MTAFGRKRPFDLTHFRVSERPLSGKADIRRLIGNGSAYKCTFSNKRAGDTECRSKYSGVRFESMNRCFLAFVFLIILMSNQVQAEELHLICTGEKLISVDRDNAWSNEIIVDLESAVVIKFETSWTLAAQDTNYAIELFAEIDDSTIKIFDRAVGPEGQWEKVFVISRVDGVVTATVTETGSIAIRGKCTRSADRDF